jgi:hypothetical protein
MFVGVAGDQPTDRTSFTQSWCDCQSHLAGSQETWVRNDRWILPTGITSSIHARRVLLHAVNLRHGTDGFTSPPKEVVPRIFIPRSGSNPRTLGPVASTLTSSPPRATYFSRVFTNFPLSSLSLSAVTLTTHPPRALRNDINYAQISWYHYLLLILDFFLGCISALFYESGSRRIFVGFTQFLWKWGYTSSAFLYHLHSQRCAMYVVYNTADIKSCLYIFSLWYRNVCDNLMMTECSKQAAVCDFN